MLRCPLFLALIFSAACGESGTGASPTGPASIEVAILVDDEPSPTATFGHDVRLVATVRNQAGATLPEAPIAWFSETPWFATIEQDGRLGIAGLGTAQIRVTSGPISRTVPVEIRIGQDSIRIRPGKSLGVLPEAIVKLTAAIFRSNGEVGEADAVQWSTTDSGIVRLATTSSFFIRLLTAGANTGTATVRVATSRNVDSVRIAVERPVVSSLELSMMAGCVIADSDRQPWCWGVGISGLFSPFMPTRDFLSPMRPPEPTGIRALALGWSVGCAIVDPGALSCWDRVGFIDPAPTRFGEPWQDVAVATPFTEGTICAIASDQHLWCWGDRQGARFTGPGVDPVPRVVRPDLSFRVIEAGQSVEGGHLCAITTDDVLWCWGQNPRGEVGVPPVAEVPAMARVEGLPPVRSVSIGGEHTCAVDFTDQVWCWGDDYWGQLGTPGSEGLLSHVPIRVDRLPAIAMVAAGGFHTCALDRAGGLWCWGRNEYGQLGLGDRIDRAIPRQVEPSIRFSVVRSTGTETCALVVGAGVSCWGRAFQYHTDYLTPREGNPAIRTAP
ncbi:MAG: hypothetical protein U0974_02240 [Gemmatimonadales bacterium]|nr:hypothetical protein [Gemmatimonadales bacterium]MDZ4388537.1 hypothetical protein [Gemmatimonadales bacterium]